MLVHNKNDVNMLTSPLVQGGNALYQQLMHDYVSRTPLSNAEKLTVILDMPWLKAFEIFPTITTPYTLAITDNPCGEYCLDLFDLGVTVLISKQTNIEEFQYAMHTALRGERQHLRVHYETPLTDHERYILRQAIFASSPQMLSSHLQRSRTSVRNTLSVIYEKLNLEGFSDLPLYYFGGIDNTFTR